MVKRTILALLCGLVSNAFALQADRSAPVHVHAEAASLNQHTHRGVYSGHVILDQGSTHLRADHAITDGDNHNQLVLATIHGSQHQQAHVWTTQSMDKPPLHAYADTIRYFPMQHRIELQGHARLIQGAHSFSAPIIRYDTRNQHVTTEQHGHERTAIVIQPPSHE
jgi:lipopolysaccharide export system protein LptA